MFNKSFSLLAAGLSILLGTYSPLSALSEFLQYAQSLSQNGVINVQSSEYGYRLSSTLSRAEGVKMTMVSAGVGQKDCRTLSSFSFTDVNASLGTLCGYIEGAVENQIISSFNTPIGKYFSPNQPITRGDFADIIVHSFDVGSPSTIGTLGDTGNGSTQASQSSYTDVPSTLRTSTSINRLATTGCINTTLTNFRPYASITRGEAFKMMSCLVGKKNGGNTINTTLTNPNTNTTATTSSNTQQQSTGSTQVSSSNGYIWSTTSYGTCSKTCGGGVQSRTISCKKTTDNSVVADSFCIATGIMKPVSQKLCNMNTCESAAVNAVSNGAISPGTSPSTSLGVTTVSSQGVPGFPWIIQGVSYSSLAEVRAVYKSPCIEINKIYSAVGFGPCISGTSTNITTITTTTSGSINSMGITTNSSALSLSGQALIDTLCTKYPAQGIISCNPAASAIVEAPSQTKCDAPIAGMHSAGAWEAKSATQVLIMDYRNIPEYFELDNIRGMVGAHPFTLWSEGGTAVFSDCAGTKQSVTQACRIVVFNDSPFALYVPRECILDAHRKYYLNHTYGGPQFKVTEAMVKYNGSSWKKKATKNTGVQLTCPQNISTGVLCFSSYESCNSGNDQYECSPGGVTSINPTVTTTASTNSSTVANSTTSSLTGARVTPWSATKCDAPIAGMHSAGFWKPGSTAQVLIMAYWNVPEYFELDNANIKNITQNYSFNIFSDGGSPSFSDCPGTSQNLICGTRGYVYDDSPYAKYAPKECVLDSNRKYYLNHTYSGPQVQFNPNMPNNNYVWKKRTQVNSSVKLTCPDGIYDGYNCNYYTQTCNSGSDQYICQTQSTTVL